MSWSLWIKSIFKWRITYCPIPVFLHEEHQSFPHNPQLLPHFYVLQNLACHHWYHFLTHQCAALPWPLCLFKVIIPTFQYHSSYPSPTPFLLIKLWPFPCSITPRLRIQTWTRMTPSNDNLFRGSLEKNFLNLKDSCCGLMVMFLFLSFFLSFFF